MTFSDLSEEEIQKTWEKWKHVVHNLLLEFNHDVFHDKGRVEENYSSFANPNFTLVFDDRYLSVGPDDNRRFAVEVARSKTDREVKAISRSDFRHTQEHL